MFYCWKILVFFGLSDEYIYYIILYIYIYIYTYIYIYITNTLTGFWIYLGFWVCQHSEHGRVVNKQELHKGLNMPRHGSICLIRTWICLNMFGFTISDRVLDMCNTIQSTRSLYKLMSAYWEISIFRTLSKI